MKKKVLIIGSGIGGLSTALRLAKAGYQVEILEKNLTAGGRLNQIKKDGFTFDTGPSFFSMSYEFDLFAKECQISLPFKFIELDPLYTVHFSGNQTPFVLYKDIDKLSAQFATIEPDFKEKITSYLEKSGQIFHDTVDLVIKQNFDSKLAYFITLARVNPANLPVLFRTFWKEVTLHFTSTEAQQIISLVAFFLGRTPFDTMAIYTLLSYTELKHDGYYNVEGGMYKIVEGLVKELEKEQVSISYGKEIVSVVKDKDKVVAVKDHQGNSWTADIFLVNSDAAFFRGKVLKRKKYAEKKLEKMNWTMGYLTFYLGIKCKLPEVEHHNYFLGDNYQAYADTIRTDLDTKQQPYYYVNVLSKYNASCAPEGCESLFFVCPVPNLLHKTNWEDKDVLVNQIVADFSQRIGVDIASEIISKTIYTPLDWQNRFNLYKGAGLGLSHSMWQIGAFRPSNFDEQFKNLFYVGASTIPGAGLPMGIISSKLVFERIEAYSKKA